MEAGNRQVLLLFKKGASRAITAPHDGDGELHLAFAIGAEELPAWESWLAENGIQVEEKQNGSAAARASISAIPTGICSKLPRLACGRFIDRLLKVATALRITAAFAARPALSTAFRGA
jgi:hypothetical protein